MSFPSLAAYLLIVGSLLVLGPRSATGFTVKLLGSEEAFGEGLVEKDLNKEDRKPIPDGGDAFPGPNGVKTFTGHRPMDVKADVDKDEEDIENSATDNFLIKYGYLKPDAVDLILEEDREAAIKAFQDFARLKVTGTIDERTKEQMFVPRCGLTDPIFSNKVANYETASSWSKKHLTWKIIKYSANLDSIKTKELVSYALQMWSNVSGLTFSEVDSEPYDLYFSFVSKDHGDGFPFDGSGGVLGHAFYPENGEIHIDDDEEFTIKSKEGINLLFVLVHEIGHALGLGHSKVEDAIMGPYYYGYTPDLKLTKDDIAGIQFLYGLPASTTAAPPTKAPEVPETKAPTTKAPITKAPATEAPTTKAPPTQAPTTKAPTQAPTTKAPTQAPTTKAPPTEAPTTKAPATQAPTTKAPTTQAPTTKAPATKAPTTLAPTTKAPTTQAPTTQAPTKAPTTEAPVVPTTPESEGPTEPSTPDPVLPCPFRFWASMTVGNRTFGFIKRLMYEILPNGRISRQGPITRTFRRGPRSVGAAAHDDETGHTFLFKGRVVYRYTDGKLDRGFPQRVKNFIRNAVVVDGQLIAFSFTHIHYLDEDSMVDYVDGEVSMKDEYPDVPYGIKSSISYGDGIAYLVYKWRVIKLDIYTGEMEEKKCRDRLTAASTSTQ